MRDVDVEVRQAYADYVTCFQRLDSLATADCFTVPLVRVAGGRSTVLDSSHSVRTMLDSLAGRLSESGYATARTERLDVDVLDETIALARATGTRQDRSGVTFERFDVVYTWVSPSPDAPWRIAVLTPVSSNRLPAPPSL